MPRENASPALDARFREALVWAAELHARQLRKGSDVPYLSHLLAVTAIVLEHGGSEEQAIAALLHDAVEDQGGAETRVEIEERFGARVARIVEACSDTDEAPKPPWRERKEAYLSRIASETEDALLVALADKLHNARSLVADYGRHGDTLWQRFNGGREGTLWYYRELVRAFAPRVEDNGLHSLWLELSATVQRLLVMAEGDETAPP